MAGWTPVFGSVFSGTLYGKYPDTAAWLIFLALCDARGQVDMTPEAIAGCSGMPLPDLLGCIKRFLEPDPTSRSQTDQGRRLAPIDPARPWGWTIVNHSQYRERARKQAWDADRTASGRDALRKRAEREAKMDESRDVPTRPDFSRLSPLSDSDSDSDSDKIQELEALSRPKKLAKRIPDDPGEILTPALKAWASSTFPDVDLAHELEAFHEYWRAEGGARARKLDWGLAFRTWLRRAPGKRNGATQQKHGVAAFSWRPDPADDEPELLPPGEIDHARQ